MEGEDSRGARAGGTAVGREIRSRDTHPEPRRVLQPGSVPWQVLGTPLCLFVVHTYKVTPTFLLFGYVFFIYIFFNFKF